MIRRSSALTYPSKAGLQDSPVIFEVVCAWSTLYDMHAVRMAAVRGGVAVAEVHIGAMQQNEGPAGHLQRHKVLCVVLWQVLVEGHRVILPACTASIFECSLLQEPSPGVRRWNPCLKIHKTICASLAMPRWHILCSDVTRLPSAVCPHLGEILQLAPADELAGHSLSTSAWQGPEAAILLDELCMIRT